MLGQVFGYAAVAESGRQLDAETIRDLVQRLLQLANKRVYLRELAATVVLVLIGGSAMCTAMLVMVKLVIQRSIATSRGLHHVSLPACSALVCSMGCRL